MLVHAMDPHHACGPFRIGHMEASTTRLLLPSSRTMVCVQDSQCVVSVQKQGSGDKLYTVTDDDATIAYLLKRMREMDPEGVGIVRSEFKKYTLSRMHSGNLRQNHRLWRRLQTKMQKQGVLELDVHMVHSHDSRYQHSFVSNSSFQCNLCCVPAATTNLFTECVLVKCIASCWQQGQPKALCVTEDVCKQAIRLHQPKAYC